MSNPSYAASARTHRFLISCNPFYLISALLMISGYYLLAIPLRTEHRLQDLIILLVVMNIYEGFLIGTAVYLQSKAPLHPHRFWLIGLEALFLCDPTFLTESFYVVNSLTGFIVNCVVFLLVAAKLALLWWLLGSKIDVVRFASRLLFYALILFLPGWICNGILHTLSSELSSWVGWNLLAFLSMSLLLWPPLKRAEKLAQVTGNTLDFLPLLMAAIHLLAVDFIVSTPIKLYYFGLPILAASIGIVRISTCLRRYAATLFAGGTVLAAIISSKGYVFTTISMPFTGTTELSTLSFVFFASGTAYLLMYIIWRKWIYFLPACIVFLLGYIGGNIQLLKKLAPQSQKGWGVFLIVLAFGALFMGIIVSFLYHQYNSRRNAGQAHET